MQIMYPDPDHVSVPGVNGAFEWGIEAEFLQLVSSCV